ncbi:hypothetical protein QJQ45_029128, partial [Haematococcus lacustris]
TKPCDTVPPKNLALPNAVEASVAAVVKGCDGQLLPKGSMIFATSTHRQRWLFSPGRLQEIRDQLNKGGTGLEFNSNGSISSLGSGAGAGKRGKGGLRAARKLLTPSHSQDHFPFYIFICLEADPFRTLLTCIYMAAKIEEAYLSAEELCRVAQRDASVVLRAEITLLQGLHFDLVVHSPYRALAGLLQDIKDLTVEAWASAPGANAPEGSGAGSAAHSLLDPDLLAASPETMAQCRAKATAAVDTLMLTDAPLLYPPGSIALAALRSGLRARGLSCTRYLHRLAAQVAEGVGSDDAADVVTESAVAAAVAQLTQMMEEVDRLGVQGMRKLEQQEVAEIDRRIKAWRASDPLQDPTSDEAKQAAAAEAAAKAAKRDAKLRERKHRAAAEEARLLGAGQGGQWTNLQLLQVDEPPAAPAPVPGGRTLGSNGMLTLAGLTVAQEEGVSCCWRIRLGSLVRRSSQQPGWQPLDPGWGEWREG